MEPDREGEAIVDVLDVLLRDGAMLQADVVVTVADIPLIGINLRAAIAGMATMREYGFFEEWDAVTRAVEEGETRAASRRGRFVPRAETGQRSGPERVPPSERPGEPVLSSDERTPPSKRPRDSTRPGQSEDDDSTRTPRPHDSARPDTNGSSLSDRPFEGGRPDGIDLRAARSERFTEDDSIADSMDGDIEELSPIDGDSEDDEHEDDEDAGDEDKTEAGDGEDKKNAGGDDEYDEEKGSEQ